MKMVPDILISDGTKFHSIRRSKVALDTYRAISSGSGISDGEQYYILSPDCVQSVIVKIKFTYDSLISGIPQFKVNLINDYDEKGTSVELQVYKDSLSVGTITVNTREISYVRSYISSNGTISNFQQGETYQVAAIKVGNVDGNISTNGVVYEMSDPATSPKETTIFLARMEIYSNLFTGWMSLNSRTRIEWGDGNVEQGRDYNSSDISSSHYRHNYSSVGTYTIILRGYPDGLTHLGPQGNSHLKEISISEDASIGPLSVDMEEPEIQSFACENSIYSINCSGSNTILSLDLARSQKLSKLSIVNCSKFASVTNSRAATEIVDLNLTNVPVSSILLDTYSKLEILTLIKTKITSVYIQSNTKLKTLNLLGSPVSTLDLSFCPDINIVDVQDTNISHITMPKSGTSKLARISINNTPLNRSEADVSSLIRSIPSGSRGYLFLDRLNYSNTVISNWQSTLVSKGWTLKY